MPPIGAGEVMPTFEFQHKETQEIVEFSAENRTEAWLLAIKHFEEQRRPTIVKPLFGDIGVIYKGDGFTGAGKGAR